MAKRRGRGRAGQRAARRLLFELPFTVPAPQMIDPDLGIRRFTRRGSEHSYTIDVTLLDTPDHRLIRSGVQLAHRVSDGLGDWYLAAPEWAPLLPEERSVPVDAEGDLPDDLAELTRPLRRRAPLGPVAAVTLERDSYLIRGTPGSKAPTDLAEAVDDVLGWVRDDRITTRRGGVVISRGREVTLEAGPGMDRGQLAHLVRVLEAAGAAPVDRFPTLPERVGAPATGLTDIPQAGRARRGETLDEFCCRLLGDDLRTIVATDLRWRTGGFDSPAPLLDDLRVAHQHLRALSGVLDPSWREAVEEHLAVLLGGDSPEFDLRRHEDDYLSLLDDLVGAARAPRLGDQSGEPAGAALRRLAESHLVVLTTRCDALASDADDADWQAALAAARQFALVAGVAALADGDPGRRLARRAQRLVSRLEPVAAAVAFPVPEQLAAMTPEQAFEAGREVERRVQHVVRTRAKFLGAWPRLRDRLAVKRART